jgi:ATP-binding cassette subfamily B protein
MTKETAIRTNDHPPDSSRPPRNAGNRPPLSHPTDPPPSPRFRIAPGAISRGVRETWQGVVRVLRLVWSTDRRLTLGLALTNVFQSLLPVAQVWLAGRLIDHVADGIRDSANADDHIRSVVVLAIIQLLIFLGSSLFQGVGNFSQQLLQERVSIVVQSQIMTHANTLDLADFENATYYDQLQEAQRESQRRPVMMVAQVFGLARSLITFGSMIALLASLSWWIAALTLLSPIPAFISDSRYGWQGFGMMRRHSPIRRAMSYLTSLMTSDQYAKEVKIFAAGDHFIARYNAVAEGYYTETKNLLIRRYSASFGWGSLTTLASSGTFLYVAVLAIRGQVTLGALTVYTQAASQVQTAFQGILGGIQGIYENGLYLSTLADLMDRSPRIAAPVQPVPVSVPFTRGIEFQNVTYRYPDRDAKALDDVSFVIEPGETIALVGQNGAGKSTIVKLIGRLYDPDEGRILVNGVDIREYDPAALRRQISVMFQDYATYQFSAADNIGIGNVELMTEQALIEEAARRAGADAVIERLPAGYQTALGKWFEGGHQLSGGEWQKVALARAFMRDTQIMILDEPTAALDARAEYELFARIQDLTTGKIALYISHRFSTARVADRIFVLERGRLMQAGTHDDLMAESGTYADLFELQAASYR